MDTSSILRTTVEALSAVDAYLASLKEEAKSFEALKVKLDSTRKLLASLQDLIKEDCSDTYYSVPHSSSEDAACRSQGNSILRLIEDGGQLNQIQKTLEEIFAWVNALETESKAKTKHLLWIRWWSSQGRQKKIERFLVELESCKSTANLVLTMAIRYGRLSTSH